MLRVLLTLAVLVPAPLFAQADAAAPSAADPRLPAVVERILVREVVERDGSVEQLTEARVALRHAAGVAQFGQLGHAYIQGLGDVSFERIAIEKADGRLVPVANAQVEDVNPFGLSAGPLAADLRFKKATVPGLEPGDRLHYRVVVRQKALIPGVVSGAFGFVDGPLAEEQVYELDAPSDLPLTLWRRPGLGAEWEDVPGRAERRVRRLRIASALQPPASPQEEESQTEPDVLYTTLGSWEELGRWWWGVARGPSQPDAAVRAEAERLVQGLAGLPERLAALHAFVSRQVRYLNVSFGLGRYEPRPAAEVLSSRYGDCKGKHVLLAALGGAVGIEVLPAMVQVRQKTLHDDVPAPAQFDHVVSVVRRGADPSRWLWLDTTNDVTVAGYLPPTLRGKRALLIGPDGTRMVTIPERPPFKTVTTVETTGSIDPTGPIRARVRWTIRDDAEPVLRAALRATPRDAWQSIGQKLAKEWSKGQVSDVQAGDLEDLSRPFWLEYGVQYAMTAATLAEEWGFWIPLPAIELPKPEKDAGPGAPLVELAISDETVVRGRIEMPEGMKARVPLSVSLDRPFATYQSTYTLEGRALTVERVLRIKQRKLPADQRAVYETFRDAIDKDRRQEFSIEAFGTAQVEAPQTADALNGAGSDALDQGDAAKAEGLFRKATEEDANHKWAWNNLGRALRKQRRHEEALRAFSRQIEINPYDAYAYGNRGSLLAFDLGRVEDGEKDMLKQIEVAPLEPWAYRDLAWLRTRQKRVAEAAELMERAAAARPSDSDVLLALAWARARAGKGDVAHAARRAVAADDRPRSAVVVARALHVAGDKAGAALLAREAVSKLVAELQAETAPEDVTRYDRDPLFLGEAWRLIGSDALARGDLETAERYLTAAFDMAFTVEAATELAALREKQGRPKEAATLRRQAAPFARKLEWTPGPRRPAAVPTPPPAPIVVEAKDNTIGLRHVKELPGSAVAEDATLQLRLVVDARGRVLQVFAADAKQAGKVDRLRSRIVGASVVSANPDRTTFKLMRSGSVSCFRGVTCYLGIDILADETTTLLEW